jgi:hypothetical protein
MKRKNQKTLFLSLVILFYSCSKSKEIEPIPLDLIISVNQFNDTTFFGRIQDIEVNGNEILLSDQGTNQVHVIDSELNYIKSFGNSGEGPGEIRGIKNIEFFNNEIFIQDLTGGMLLKFNSEHHFMEEFKMLLSSTKFSILNNRVFAQSSSHSSLEPLSIFTLGDSVIESNFGIGSDKNLNNPSQHVLIKDDILLAIFHENKPIINTYDTDGNFLASTDFSNHPNLEPWLESLDIQTKISASTPSVRYSQGVFYDADFFEDKLYLNLPKVGINPETRKSIMLECQLNEDYSLEIIRIFEFEDHSSFPCFSIVDDGKSILLYDPVYGALEKYRIPTSK